MYFRTYLFMILLSTVFCEICCFFVEMITQTLGSVAQFRITITQTRGILAHFHIVITQTLGLVAQFHIKV